MKYKSQLEHFPEEVVKKMLEHQQAQGNAAEVSVFENNPTCGAKFGGFDWWNTPEKDYFWNQVIAKGDFNLFFEKYPKDELIGYKLRGIASWNQVCNLLNYAMPHKNKKHDLFFDKSYISSPLFKKIESLGVLNLWFTPVYEKKEEPKIIRHKMYADNGEFELEISKEGICYRADGTWLNTSDIRDILHISKKKVIRFSKGYNTDITGRYEMIITKMDVGCKQGTRVSDWQKALELYYKLFK